MHIIVKIQLGETIMAILTSKTVYGFFHSFTWFFYFSNFAG